MIDQLFEDRALADIAQRDDTYAATMDVVQAWEAIRGDLRSRGPFTRMLLEFRGTAQQAMQDLVYANPSDARVVASLQNEVRRYAHLMTIISEYRTQAEAVIANEGDGEDISEEDSEFIATLER
ncbi:hypothetical protein ASD54_12320 [Rhizobium sp. Root149]|uniref:hypothetical protein n=1 Tax=Rhizobium sp. Root149 TaxID=1736473 RepID=UPI000712FCE9|nr:hypothetical protein [Rhizobium sp. Root149]KQZ49717.1 hypothetical protein ASD54_12320 [Rhizobium sp. Root149]